MAVLNKMGSTDSLHKKLLGLSLHFVIFCTNIIFLFLWICLQSTYWNDKTNLANAAHTVQM